MLRARFIWGNMNVPGISIHMNQRTISTWDQLIKVKGKGNAVLKCPLLDSGDIQETLLVQ
jgi:hypothetical protein